MVVHLTSPDNRYDMTYLRNYAVLNVKDRLARLQGVGEVGLFGSGDYAMRVWLDPQKVAQRNLTATEIVSAIREQNIQVAAGTIGASPSNSPLQLSVNAQGRLTTEQEFADIILKTAPDGAVTRLGMWLVLNSQPLNMACVHYSIINKQSQFQFSKHRVRMLYKFPIKCVAR